MDASTTPAELTPDGFTPFHGSPGFVRHCGGLHVHSELPIVGVRIAPHHLNPVRIAHGGFLATVADSAFGVILRRHMGTGVPPITVSLSVDYIGGVREGDWLEAHVEVLKSHGNLINASCLLKVGERVVLRSSGVFTRWKGPLPEHA